MVLIMSVLLIISLLIVNSSGQECSVDGNLCDTHERCPVWGKEGQCIKNEAYMKEYCPMSCLNVKPPDIDGTCKDYFEHCPKWASLGECDEIPGIMKRYCKESCDACREGGSDSSCFDKHEHCSFWASNGECEANPVYMLENCAKSCKTCEDDDDIDDDVEATATGAVTVSSEAVDLMAQTTSFGIEQLISGNAEEQSSTTAIIVDSIKYMQNEASKLSEITLEKCKNNEKLCSFWAGMGECEKTVVYMQQNCAPACRNCHLLDA